MRCLRGICKHCAVALVEKIWPTCSLSFTNCDWIIKSYYFYCEFEDVDFWRQKNPPWICSWWLMMCSSCCVNHSYPENSLFCFIVFRLLLHCTRDIITWFLALLSGASKEISSFDNSDFSVPKTTTKVILIQGDLRETRSFSIPPKVPKTISYYLLCRCPNPVS